MMQKKHNWKGLEKSGDLSTNASLITFLMSSNALTGSLPHATISFFLNILEMDLVVSIKFVTNILTKLIWPKND